MAISKKKNNAKAAKSIKKPVVKKIAAKAKVTKAAKPATKKKVEKPAAKKNTIAKKTPAKVKVQTKKTVAPKKVVKAASKPAKPIAGKVAKAVSKPATTTPKKVAKAEVVKKAKKSEEKVKITPVIAEPEAEKKTRGRKKGSVAKKDSSTVAKKETGTATPSSDMDFAFLIAEQMKQEQLKQMEEDAKNNPEIILSERPDSRHARKKTVKFPKADLMQFKTELLKRRDTFLSQYKNLRSVAYEQNQERTQDGGEGTDIHMLGQTLEIADKLAADIARIDEALHKIDDGTYGVCISCNKLIRKQRLEIEPFVRTCMECQKAIEKTR